MLTVDFDRLGLRPGDRVLDMGCGAGRHAFEMYRRGADVIAFDKDADELAGVRELFAAMREAGEVPAGAEADVKQGDALACRSPTASSTGSSPPRCSSTSPTTSRRSPSWCGCCVPAARWRSRCRAGCRSRSAGRSPTSTTRSRAATSASTPTDELVARSSRAPGCAYVGKDYAHGLHSPYWWIKCAVGVDNDDHPLAKAYHQVLVWDIMKRPPALTRLAEQGAQPADRQEHGALLPQAGGAADPEPETSASRTSPASSRAAQVAETAAAIAGDAGADGAIPWTVGEHIDVWNHVEAAMALLVGGADRGRGGGVRVVPRTQRADGSWPMKIVGGVVEDASGETNMSAYLAVGIWHHWLLRRDMAFVAAIWPAVRARRSTSWPSMQLPFGGIAWSQQGDGKVNEEALLAGSSSIYHSLRAGVALADLMGDPQPGGSSPAAGSGHALREHRDLFLDKSTFSMDWYYPVLSGAAARRAGASSCSTAGGTTSSSPGLGSAASTTTRG